MAYQSGHQAPPPGADLLRGARAMLGWSLTEAGQRAAVSVATVVSAEGRSIRFTVVPPAALDRLRQAYEAAGVCFRDEPATERGLQFGHSRTEQDRLRELSRHLR